MVIVHGRDLLLNEQFPDKFRKSVNRKLEARGVELVLGDYVAKFPENGGGDIIFRSGKRLQADLVVRTSLSLCFRSYMHLVSNQIYFIGPYIRTQTKHYLDIRFSGLKLALA